MYADNITDSMKSAIDETNRRRDIQKQYNEENNITPTTIKKAVQDQISIYKEIAEEDNEMLTGVDAMDKEELEALIKKLTDKMGKAAADLNFELAADYRDQAIELKNSLRDM